MSAHKFRFIIFDDNDCRFLGTDDEALAKEYAEGHNVYDTETGLELPSAYVGEKGLPLDEAPALDEDGEPVDG